jgi:uncharacterized protein (TIGR02246 family)
MHDAFPHTPRMAERSDRGVIAAEEERLIRALLARLFAAWANGDGEAYASCFTKDCDYVTFNGIHLHGRGENRAFHDALFRTVLRGTQLSAEIETLELLASGVALMRTAGQGRKRSYQTYVLIKRGDEWLIRSFQNTKVQPLSIWITRWMQRRGTR